MLDVTPSRYDPEDFCNASFHEASTELIGHGFEEVELIARYIGNVQ